MNDVSNIKGEIYHKMVFPLSGSFFCLFLVTEFVELNLKKNKE